MHADRIWWNSEYPNVLNASALLELPAYQPKDKAKTIKCPTLVVHCETDTFCLTPGAEAVAAASPHVELVQLPTGIDISQ